MLWKISKNANGFCYIGQVLVALWQVLNMIVMPFSKWVASRNCSYEIQGYDEKNHVFVDMLSLQNMFVLNFLWLCLHML